MNKSIKILVVDDSLIMRKNITRMLEELGHNVVSEAKTGKEAIAHYSMQKPDLVTMDITMPDMDGIDAVTNIKKRNPEAKIIMITAHGQEDMVIKSIKAGAKAYILKPITPIKIDEAINKLFNIEKVEERSENIKDLDEDDFSM